MKTEELKKHLTAYITAARDYNTRKRIFWEERDEMENKILGAFALPVTQNIYTMMYKAATGKGTVEDKAEELSGMLQQEAEAFFTAPARTDINVLKEAKENKENDQNVLPLMGFSWGDYNSFLYHDVYMKGLCDEKQLLSALQQAKPYKLPFFIKDINSKKALADLQEKTGLPWLTEYRDYVKYVRGRHPWNMGHRNKKRSLYNLPEKMKLDYFYISRIMGRTDHVWISVLVPYEEDYVELNVLLTYDKLYELLDAARYYHISYDALHAIEYYRGGLTEFEQFIINCKKEIGLKIEILNANLEIVPYTGPLSNSLRGIYYRSEDFYI